MMHFKKRKASAIPSTSGSFTGTAIGIWRLLDRDCQRATVTTLLTMTLYCLLDMANIGAIAVFVACINDTQYVYNSWISVLFDVIPYSWQSSTDRLLLTICIGTACVVSIRNAVKVGYDIKLTSLFSKIDGYFGNSTLQRLLRVRYEAFNKYRQTDVLRYIDLRTLFGSDFTKSCMSLSQSVVFFVIAFSTLIVSYYEITLIIIACIGSLAFFIYRFGEKMLARASAEYMQEHISTQRKVAFLFNAMKEIKITGQEAKIEALFRRIFQVVGKKRSTLLVTSRVLTNMMELSGTITLLIAIMLMLHLGKSSSYAASVAAVFALTSLRVLGAATGALAEVSAMRGLLPFLSDIIGFLCTSPQTTDMDIIPDDNEPKISFNSITFVDYTYYYPDAKIAALSDITLEIQKGELIGVIGLSGSGKSTLLDALLGIIKPQKGFIQIDGRELSDLELRIWSRGIGYVPQQPYLFEGNFAQNVAMQTDIDDIDKDLLSESIARAGIDFIPKEQQFSFPIEEGGKNLSGGQIQRVAIARSFYRESTILAFDEPTSSLDLYNIGIFLETIEKLRSNATIIIVSHDIEHVKTFDRLIWLDGGRIRMDGCPEKVLKEYISYARRP